MKIKTKNLVTICSLIMLVIMAFMVINIFHKDEHVKFINIQSLNVSRDGFVMTVVDTDNEIYQWERANVFQRKEFEAIYSVLLVAKTVESEVMITFIEDEDLGIHDLTSVNIVN